MSDKINLSGESFPIAILSDEQKTAIRDEARLARALEGTPVAIGYTEPKQGDIPGTGRHSAPSVLSLLR